MPGAELQSHIADVSNRDLSAQHVYTQLANPSFEPLGGPLPGWRLISDPTKTVASLDATVKQDGKSSLYLRSDGPLAAVESDSLPVPATGQLMMTVFARAKNCGPITDLKLIIEADQEGQPYRQTAQVAAAGLERADQTWGRPIAILVSDLPLDSQVKMRSRLRSHWSR